MTERAEIHLAPPLDSYVAATSISEAQLTSAYEPLPEARPCVCGDVVVADRRDPGDGVLEHQASPKHRAWRAWCET